MKKNRKKIALILALSLTLMASISALAGQTTKITSRYEIPPIEVVIPTAGRAVINPFNLPVDIKADDGKTLIGTPWTNAGQIVTKPLVGYNMSGFALKVGATVLGEPTGDFKLVDTDPTTDDTITTKSGQVYLEVQASTSDLGYVLGQDTKTSPTTTIGGLTGTTVSSALQGWAQTPYTDADYQLLVGRSAATKRGMCEIAAATTATTTAPDGSTITGTGPDTNGYFMARLCGKVVAVPKEDWVPTDGLDATITWIIEPA